MIRISPSRSYLLALCVAAALLGTPTASFAESSHQPAITEARADGAMLRIDGFDLGGGTPKLTLGSAALSIVSTTATHIDALLPVGVAPGSYLLTLTLGKGGNDDNNKFDEFWVTIGAAGPQGSAGATGLQGAMGPIGPQGIPGVAGPAGKDGVVGTQGPSGPQGVPGPAGPTGAGGTLSSIDALAGLACNVVNSGEACQGIAAVTFDPATNGLGLICQPPASKPTLTLSYRGARTGQVIHVFGKVSMVRIAPGDSGVRTALTCPGEVLVVTVALGHDGPVPNPGNITVNGGSCSSVVLTPDTSVDCTITMNGDQTIRF